MEWRNVGAGTGSTGSLPMRAKRKVEGRSCCRSLRAAEVSEFRLGLSCSSRLSCRVRLPPLHRFFRSGSDEAREPRCRCAELRGIRALAGFFGGFSPTSARAPGHCPKKTIGRATSRDPRGESRLRRYGFGHPRGRWRGSCRLGRRSCDAQVGLTSDATELTLAPVRTGNPVRGHDRRGLRAASTRERGPMHLV